ncbi:MAG: HIT family protein [Bacteroidetes bacterium]|nr:HIT family protein [Bacteroidota bacterium]
MASIFTRIVNGEIPCYKIAEDVNYLAFLDINPLQEGHTLVIPKKEINYIFDMDDELHAGLWNFSKKVAKAIEKVVQCQRIGITVIGLEVPHAHIHLIPLKTMYDMDFRKPKLKFTNEEFAAIAKKITDALEHKI